MKKATLIFSLTLLMLSIGEWSQAQDWPDLSRYKIDNEALGLPLSGETRIVFMGNSITDNWDNTSPDFFKNRPYINRGISGQTTPQMLVRFRPDVIKLKPEVVVILAGTNDIAGNTGPSTLEMIMDNIISMAQLAQSNGIKVILCSVLPAFDYSWRPGKNPVEKIPALNAMIKKYADENNIIYLDYYSAMVDERGGLKVEYTNDGVHPTKVGYDVMEPMVEEAIKKALMKE